MCIFIFNVKLMLLLVMGFLAFAYFLRLYFGEIGEKKFLAVNSSFIQVKSPIPVMTTSTPTTVVREQNLALRVMRLSNPMLNESICLGRDPADSFSVAICDSVAKLSGQCSVDVPLDPYLIAPHAMSEVYLGETFTLYISIINISAYTCKEIVIKMDIQTQNQRVALGELAFTGIAIEPNQQIGQIFKHDIQELGQHILVCAVTYRSVGAESQTEDAMNLRKFFKFSVASSLEFVSQKFCEGVQNSSTLFEVQLRNLCSVPVVIEHISLANGAVKPLGRMVGDDHSSDVLSPKSLRRFLFMLENLRTNQKSAGPIEIRWRTTMGERGKIRWETTAQQLVPNFGDLRLSMVQSPKEVRLNEAFIAQFQLQNTSDRSLDLLLTLISESQQPAPPPLSAEGGGGGQQQHASSSLQFGPFIHCSLSGQRLPMVLPSHCLKFDLDLLPIVPGLQTVSGIRLTDTVSKRTYEFDDVARLFVFH